MIELEAAFQPVFGTHMTTEVILWQRVVNTKAVMWMLGPRPPAGGLGPGDVAARRPRGPRPLGEPAAAQRGRGPRCLLREIRGRRPVCVLAQDATWDGSRRDSPAGARSSSSSRAGRRRAGIDGADRRRAAAGRGHGEPERLAHGPGARAGAALFITPARARSTGRSPELSVRRQIVRPLRRVPPGVADGLPQASAARSARRRVADARA